MKLLKEGDVNLRAAQVSPNGSAVPLKTQCAHTWARAMRKGICKATPAKLVASCLLLCDARSGCGWAKWNKLPRHHVPTGVLSWGHNLMSLCCKCNTRVSLGSRCCVGVAVSQKLQKQLWINYILATHQLPAKGRESWITEGAKERLKNLQNNFSELKNQK